MIELILFGTFLVLLLIGVPVAFSLGLGAMATILYIGYLEDLQTVPSVVFASLSSETLLAIPFFILAGAIMEAAGISQRLVDFADASVGHFKHGLVFVVIIAAFFFSAISGSGPATVAAIGTILIPAMVRKGYTPGHAASLMASAGSMGIVIPPSIAFIVFAVVVSDYERVSIARLFVAGVVPGLIMAASLMIAATFLPRQSMSSVPTGGTDDGDGATPVVDEPHSFSGSHFARSFAHAIPGLMVPLIILGGIYGGIFTPTESAVVAAAFAMLVGLFVYRQLKVRLLGRLFAQAAVQTATVMLIVGSASVFAYVITRNQVAQTVADALLGITQNRYLILLIVLVLLMIVGMFMDAVSALYLFVPLLVPVLLEVGVDITTIGVLMVVNLAVGLVTPPVGVNLFVAAGIAKASLTDVIRGVWPFLGASVAALLTITYIPALSNWLPDQLGL